MNYPDGSLPKVDCSVYLHVLLYLRQHEVPLSLCNFVSEDLPLHCKPFSVRSRFRRSFRKYAIRHECIQRPFFTILSTAPQRSRKAVRCDYVRIILPDLVGKG